MSALLSKLINDSKAEEWNEYDIPKLKLREIQVLCLLLGAPKSGRKEEVVTRLLAVRHVRLNIAPFSSTREGMGLLADAFRKEKLKWMAKEAGLWRSGNKIQLANVLINWREKCRLQGQQLLSELLAQRNSRPRQALLPL